MIGDDKTLNDYITSAQGVTRRGLNIMCLVGVFIFGWLLSVAFDLLGKKGTGWLYLVPLIGLMVISQNSTSPLVLLAPVLYLAGWVHANLVLSRYHALARQRIIAIEAQKESTVDILLEKGLLYGKVLGDKESAQRAFAEALVSPQDGSPQLLNLGGFTLMKSGCLEQAMSLFERALSATSDPDQVAVIKSNLETCVKKARKVKPERSVRNVLRSVWTKS